MTHTRLLRSHLATVTVVAAAIAVFALAAWSGRAVSSITIFGNESGAAGLLNTNGRIDATNPFFQTLGTNGRSCATCHVMNQGMSITPAKIQVRFSNSQGLDPIFRNNDGANCPSADTSTVEARRAAFSLLLSKGLIRVSMPVPTGADFVITAIDDPYVCPETNSTTPALYRRPLPSVNLPFLSAVMWDGRETVPGDLTASLLNQARDATLGHAQAAVAPSDEQLAQIVAFETSLFFAQTNDNRAESLTAAGAQGGPAPLSRQEFYLGINDPLADGSAFSPKIFSLYDAWSGVDGNSSTDKARAAVARGQLLFNSLPIAISGVAGLNDVVGKDSISGFCGTCHDAPNAGDHSVSLPINIGISDASRRTPDMPLYTVTCFMPKGVKLVQTMDLGRAMITGKCQDIGKFKGPILRGLAARAPYFHDGSAATLLDVVNFYNVRFNLNLSEAQKNDLLAFLQTL